MKTALRTAAWAWFALLAAVAIVLATPVGPRGAAILLSLVAAVGTATLALRLKPSPVARPLLVLLAIGLTSLSVVLIAGGAL